MSESPAVDKQQALAARLKAIGFVEMPEGFSLTLAGPLLFPTNGDQLAADSKAELERLGKELTAIGVPRIKVNGHTDSTGTEAINNSLSTRRAISVSEALKLGGVDLAKVEIQGFAARFPVAPNDSEAGRAQNRRVVILIPN